ncbi:MAG: hypothetical protein ABSE48_09115 [Verrucomicrobiota bacterium]|jgi:hypothetical protein
MNNSEQEFEDLKQLLKLKRHEIPPPGFFSSFSNQVLSAIREERTGRAASHVNYNFPWFLRFLGVFDSRPGLVGGLATSLMLLLVFGVVLSDHSDTDYNSQNVFAPGTSVQNSSPAASSALPTDVASADQATSGGITVSTNPVASLQPTAVLFGQQNPLFQSASFQLAGSPAH